MTLPLDSAAVARYLIDHPHFFEGEAELISKIKLISPLGGRTVSLQERQMEVLREKIKSLEMQMAALLRIGHENDAISEKFHALTQSLLLARNDVDLPTVLINGLQTIFSVPQATLRVWGVAEAFSHTWFAAEVSTDARIFSNGLDTPFCGANNDFEAAAWLEEPSAIRSLAMLPLRLDGAADAFGLVVLGSPDATRFTSDMGVAFLTQVSQTASAALTCLLD
ncbi:MAG: DUF484 family protein [Pseudomonadota bacterium]